MKLIVGLGNPGEQYKLTRHNIGFIFIDEYLKENNISDMREKFKSLFVQTNYNGDKVFYQKPTTFMNLSGHNGIKSIISHVGNEFVRIKFGIGKPKTKEETLGFVLGKFSPEEKEVLKDSREKIFNLIDDIKDDMTVQKLMNKYNTK